ncbi:MAG TPA: glycosyltransferase family 9 protein [bacterium]|nr:glycosyltransferase family 9 protein [bacterium]
MTQPILALAAGSLGDSILTLPALQTLSTRGPVTLAATSPFLALGAEAFGVSKMIPLDPLLDSLYGGKPALPADAGELFVFFKERDARLEKALAALAPLKVHWPRQAFSDFLKEERWVGHYWLDLVGFADPSPTARLLLSDEMRARGSALCAALGAPQPFVLHPGSGSRAKNAPLSFFRKAAEKTASETARQVLVLWGEAERDWLPEIKAAFKDIPKVTVLEEPLPLADLAALLTQACGYLGNDSGVTQLASACGVRTFAVFNSTDPKLWGPQESIILAAMSRNL